MNPPMNPTRSYRLRLELAAAARLAAPVALVQLGLMFMGVVDTMMLGHLSAAALAAGALGHISTVGLLFLGNGVLTALDPLVAQAHGAGDRAAVGAHLQRGIVLGLVMVIPIGLLLWDVRPALLALGQPAAVTAEAAAFARGMIWGLPGYFLFVTFRQTLQAMSVVRPAALAIVLGNVANALGNWVLIFGHLGMPALGVRGSAYSTSICRTAMCLWLLFTSRRRLAPFWQGFTREAFDLPKLLRLLRIGLPIGLHQSVEVVLFITVALLMGRMGIVQLAGHQIAINLVSVSFMLPLGVAGAAATRVGNAVGRQDMPGARRAAAACLLLGAGVMLVFATLFAAFPEALGRLYTEDRDVIAMTALLLPVAAVFQVFDGVQTVSAGVLRGVADTTIPAVIALVGFWLIGLPAGWLLAFQLGQGPRGLWWGLTAGLTAVALLQVARIAHRFRGTIARV
jgi:multidrug resistance protein, MATE family